MTIRCFASHVLHALRTLAVLRWPGTKRAFTDFPPTNRRARFVVIKLPEQASERASGLLARLSNKKLAPERIRLRALLIRSQASWISSPKVAQRNLFGRPACTATEPLSIFPNKLNTNLESTSVDHQQYFSRDEQLALLRFMSLPSFHASWKNVVQPSPGNSFTSTKRHHAASTEEQRSRNGGSYSDGAFQ